MKTMHKRSILAVASLFAFGVACAETPPGATGEGPKTQLQKGFTGELRSGVWSNEGFSRLDTNRDGMLSREEGALDATIRAAWSKLDPRNLGRVTRAEFDKYATTAEPQPNQFNSGGPAPTAKPKS